MRRSNRMRQILREAREQQRQEVHDKIDVELHTVGLQHFGAAIAQRMELIEVLAARFNNDSRMIRRLCLEVLDRIASILEPELQSKLNADSRRTLPIRRTARTNLGNKCLKPERLDSPYSQRDAHSYGFRIPLSIVPE